MDITSLHTNWNYPTTIWFGPGRVREIALACRQLHIQAPMIVTDPGLAELPMIQQVMDDLTQVGLNPVLYSRIKANPTGTHVTEGCQALHDHHRDGIIAIGGGSALDTGKTIGFLAHQSLSLWEFEDIGDNYKKADVSNILPIIAIPTTAGTGSEVGRAALIVDEVAHTKRIIFHPKMLPSLVISDPKLTLSLPPKLTAATGMDALAHNLEAFCAPGFHPMADGIALEGMRLIKTWLPIAYRDGSHLEARTHLLAAATMGATAFQKGLGAIHSLSHPVGALFDAHHGLLNAIFMPYVLKYNRDAIHEKMQRLAEYLHLKPQNFEGVYHWVLSLLATLNLPTKLSDIGITADQADTIAALALQDGSTPTNPLPLTQADLKRLFEDALIGRL